MKQITWISNDENDIFEKILYTSSNNITTPLVTEDGLFIHHYIKTPLYNGLYKNEIEVTESNHKAIDNFNLLIDQIDLYKLSFIYKFINDIHLPWVIRLLQIVLIKNFNYHVDNISYTLKNQQIIFTPMFNINNNIVDLYCSKLKLEEILNTIDLSLFIGYKPLLDLYPGYVDITLVSSDLIWICDLKLFKYKNIYNIPCIEVMGKDEQEAIAKMSEFGISTIAPILTHIYNYNINTFSIVKKPLIKNIIKFYQFIKIPSLLKDLIFIKNDLIRKDWIYQSEKLIYNNQLPIISIINDWVIKYESNIKTMAYIKYNSILSYINLYQNQPILLKHINQINITSDLIVHLPIYDIKDVEYFKNNILENINNNQNYFVKQFDNKNDAIFTQMMLSKNLPYLAFPVFDTWFVAGSIEPPETFKTTYKFKDNNIHGIFNINVPCELLDIIKINMINGILDIDKLIINLPWNETIKNYLSIFLNINDPKNKKLWITGQLFNDWAILYFQKLNQFSILPLKIKKIKTNKFLKN